MDALATVQQDTEKQALDLQDVTPPQVITGGLPQLASTPTVDSRKVHRNTLRGLGIMEIIIGGIAVMLSIFAIVIIPIDSVYHNGPSPLHRNEHKVRLICASSGVWGGLCIIATGIAGISGKFKPSRRMNVANLTMATITSIVALAAGAVSVYSAGLVSMGYSSIYLTLIHSVECILLFVAAIVTISHAASCCKIVCGDQDVVGNRQASDIHREHLSTVSATMSIMHPMQTIAIQGPSQICGNTFPFAESIQTDSPPTYSQSQLCYDEELNNEESNS